MVQCFSNRNRRLNRSFWRCPEALLGTHDDLGTTCDRAGPFKGRRGGAVPVVSNPSAKPARAYRRTSVEWTPAGRIAKSRGQTNPQREGESDLSARDESSGGQATRRWTVARGAAPPGSVFQIVADPISEKGFFEKMTRQGEEAIGKLAQDLLENPMVSGALSAALETRERAMRAQEVALGALNLPSASDLERLTRRLRSVSQRLEGVEDVLDRVERRVEGLDDSPLERRLAAIEEALGRIEKALKARA